MANPYSRARGILFLCLLVSGCSNTPEPVNEADVTAVLDAFYGAMKTGDTAAAMSHIAADAVFIETGRLETREEYEKNHLPNDIAFEKQVTGKRSPWQVKSQGDTAWVIASTNFDGAFDGRPVSFVSSQLAVLSRVDNRWQIRSIHWSSRLP